MRIVNKLIAGAGLTLLLLSITLAALWWSTAIFVAAAMPLTARVFVSGGVALAFLALGGLTLSSRWRWRWKALAVLLLMQAPLIVWWHQIPASNDRAWQADVARLAHASIAGDFVTVVNIRDFDYRTETDFTPRWITRRYDLRTLEGVDLFAVYWMGPHIAHVIVSFNFRGQEPLAISIEARKEHGEDYSTWRGFFRQFELIYVVATEQDVVKLRTNYRHNPPETVYRFPLRNAGPARERDFFLEYMNKVNALNERPEFYNTLATNCTTSIWLMTLANSGHLPFSWKLLASGHVPEYLYEQGRLDSGRPYSELLEGALVHPPARPASAEPYFSTAIRGIRSNVPTAASGAAANPR